MSSETVILRRMHLKRKSKRPYVMMYSLGRGRVLYCNNPKEADVFPTSEYAIDFMKRLDNKNTKVICLPVVTFKSSGGHLIFKSFKNDKIYTKKKEP